MVAARQPKVFAGELRPYQQVGLGWMKALRDRGVGGVLADDGDPDGAVLEPRGRGPVYRLIAAGTVEEKVRELQAAKRWLANEIVDLQHDGRDQLTREVVETMLAAEPLRGHEPDR